MSESMYVPPELANARKRAQGQKLFVWGAIAAGVGCVGALLSVVLKVVWLGILGGPIGKRSRSGFSAAYSHWPNNTTSTTEPTGMTD